MHVFPLANFIEELVVALGVLLAASYMFWQVREIRLTVWQLLWLVLGVLFAASAWIHPAPFASYKMLIGAFWLIGYLALVVGDQVDWDARGDQLSFILAVALLVAALLCAIGGFMRFYGLMGGAWRAYVPEPNTGRMTGLVGHSNFFAFISLFGLIAAGWLLNAKRIGVGLCVFSVVVLVTALIATGSRGALLVWIAVVLVLCVRRKIAAVGPWLLVMTGAFVFYWIFKPVFFAFDHWFYALVLEKGWVGGLGTSSSDVVGRGVVSSQRLDEWKVAVELLRQNFWSGVGIGNYGVSSYQQHLRWGMVSPDGIFTHTHNSPLQLVVELGVAGLVWLLVLLIAAGKAFWRASVDQSKLLPLLIVLVIQIYGMVEFPMWMMHFLVLNMLLLGALGGPRITGNLKLGKIFAVLTMLGVLLVSVIYMPIAERFVWSYRQTFIRAEVDRSEYGFIDSVIRNPLLEPYGYLTYFANFNLSPGAISTESTVLKRLEGYLPFPQVLVRTALVSMVMGDEVRAQKAVADLRIFYGLGYEQLLASQIDVNQPKFPDVNFDRLRLGEAVKPSDEQPEK